MKHVVIVAMNSHGETAGYGVMVKETYSKWRRRPPASRPDAFSLLYGGHPDCATFNIFPAVKQYLADCGGVIEDIIPCMAY